MFCYALSMARLGMVNAFATALGEEIGWRGFLAPCIFEKPNLTAGTVIVGIDMLWHLPVIVFGMYNQGTSLLSVAMISASIISTMLRQRSRSVAEHGTPRRP